MFGGPSLFAHLAHVTYEALAEITEDKKEKSHQVMISTNGHRSGNSILYPWAYTSYATTPGS